MNDSVKKNVPEDIKTNLTQLVSGLKETESLDTLKKLMNQGYKPSELFACCMDGVREVGSSFERGEYYISALIMAGEIMRQASDILKSAEPAIQPDEEILGHVLLGTIKGDIHDLGKNILKDMLQCNGFTVTDLGVDVPVETFAAKTLELNPDFVAISCLLTNCLDNLAQAVGAVRETVTRNRKLIVVGGNSLDQLVSDYVKADIWFSDAVQAVEFCKDAVKLKNKYQPV